VNVVLPPVIDLLANKSTAPAGVAGQLKITTEQKSAVRAHDHYSPPQDGSQSDDSSSEGAAKTVPSLGQNCDFFLLINQSVAGDAQSIPCEL